MIQEESLDKTSQLLIADLVGDVANMDITEEIADSTHKQIWWKVILQDMKFLVNRRV